MTTLVPLPGRDYKSAKAVKEAWDSGKDFIVCDMFSLWDGKYANKESFSDCVSVRYNKLTKLVVVKGVK
jgi:hypothetical protein